MLANDKQSAKLILSEHDINLVIWENNIFDLNFYKENLTFIPIILVNDFYDYDKLTLKNFKCVSLDKLTLLSYYIHKYISLSDTFENTKLTILKELIYLGFNVRHNGTKYITESILILKFFCKNSNLKDIYSIIARKHSTSCNIFKFCYLSFFIAYILIYFITLYVVLFIFKANSYLYEDLIDISF